MTAPESSTNGESAHVLKDASALTIGVVGSVISAVVGFGMILALLNGSIVFAFILGIITAATGLFGWFGLREHLRWEPAELHFDQWPLALGSTTTVRLQRRSKRPLADSTFTVSVDLTCTEEAEYTVGTDTHTASDTVVRQSSTTPGTVAAGLLAATFDVHIPVDAGGPTLELRNNKVRWDLALDTEEGGVLSRRSHELIVAPHLDRRLQHIQDAPEETR